MGLAMPFAFARRWMAGSSIREIYEHIALRVALLIALGLVLNAVSHVSPLRLPGVLQRLALAYLVASIVVLHVRPSRWLAVAAALLIGHWALLALAPFGDQPAGTMTPDHNLAGFIDTLVFGRHALTIPIDPEGLLGTLTASATAVLGAVAGDLVRRAPDNAVRLRELTAGSAAALGLGLLWSRALPLSKPLWTGSFVLVTAGLTTIAFALMYFIVDVRGLRRWSRPFVWLGANALAIYAGSEVVRRLLDAAVVTQGSGRTTPKAWVFWDVLEPAFRPWPEAASFVFAVGVLAIWMVVAGVLYRFKRL
jgi:predicted acyltransferase